MHFVADLIFKIFVHIVHVFFYLRPQSTVKTNKYETLWNYLRTPNCLLIVFRSNTNTSVSPLGIIDTKVPKCTARLFILVNKQSE